MFSVNKLFLNHLSIFVIFLCRALVNSVGLADFIIILVSSANKTVVANGCICLGRSFICIKKNSGPKTEPCGTPCLVGFHSE